MRKIYLLAIISIMALTSNAQGFFAQDPCMAELINKGCKEEYQTIEIVNSLLSPKPCTDMKVRITLSKLVCNGKVVSMHIWSAGANASTGSCNPPMSGMNNPDWEDLKAKMRIAVNQEIGNLIGSLGLDRVLVSTGSACKSEVTFEMPQFTSSYQQEDPSGRLPNLLVTQPGGKFTYTIPCKSDGCCFGYADVVDNKVVGVTPSDNPISPDCPVQLTTADVQAWFKQTFQVWNNGEKNMFNVVIKPCEQDCDLSRLIGDFQGVNLLKSVAKPTAGQKIDYNVNIESIKDAQLTFKSDIMPTHYQILDINGRVVENKLIQSNVIDIKPLTKGIFFFKANYDNGISSVVKFVKD